MNDEMKYYVPGDVVVLKHKELNSPVMLIVDKVTRTFLNKDTNESNSTFVGMKCKWFTKDGAIQESVFSTKDLEHYNG